MHNWCLLIVALIALLRPIASFTERNLVDGRQQCCDHQQGLLLRDTRLSLEASRRQTRQDQKLDQRNDIFARPLLNSKQSIPRDSVEKYKDTDNIVRFSRTDYRDLKHIDKENINRRAAGLRFSRNFVSERYNVASIRCSSQNKQPTYPDGKSNHRTTPDTRLNFLRQQDDSSKLRTNTAIREEIKTSKYDLEQEKLRNRNNRRITKEIRSMDRLSSPLRSLDNNNRQSRFRKSASASKRSVTPSIENVDIRQHYRQNELNPITEDRRVEYKRIPDHQSKNVTPDRRLQRSFDDSSRREARFNVIRIKAILGRVNHRESDRSRRFVRSERRHHIIEISSIINGVRDAIPVESKNNMRDITTNEMSRREIVKQERRNLIHRNPVTDDRNRNLNTRRNQVVSYNIRKDTFRPKTTAKIEPLSHIRNAESNNRIRFIMIANDRPQSIRQIESQLISKRKTERLTEERKQTIRDMNTQLRARNTIDGERGNIVATRIQETQRVESITLRTRVDNRDLTRRAVRDENKQFKLYSARQLSKDMLRPVVKNKIDDKQRTMDERRHTAMRRIDTRETNKYINQRDSNNRAPSLDLMHFRETTRTEIRSTNIDERSEARKIFNAIKENRDHQSTKSRLRSAEIVANRNIYKEFSKINTDDRIFGNWQILFYILQGFYICGIIAQAYKESGFVKPKTK